MGIEADYWIRIDKVMITKFNEFVVQYCLVLQ